MRRTKGVRPESYGSHRSASLSFCTVLSAWLRLCKDGDRDVLFGTLNGTHDKEDTVDDNADVAEELAELGSSTENSTKRGGIGETLWGLEVSLSCPHGAKLFAYQR